MNRTIFPANHNARHPLRRALPPPQVPVAPRGDDHDLKLFVLSFTAFFVCFYTLIM
jgi:hypothetical protein